MSTPKMDLFLYPNELGKATLSDGAQVLEHFMARFTFGSSIVEIDVRTAEGKSRVTAISIDETDTERGVVGVTVNRLSVSQLLERAVRGNAWMCTAPSGMSLEAFQTDSARVNRAAGVATRQRLSVERLARVAEILSAGGGVKDVMAAEPISERQAFRLIKRAKELQR